MERADRQPAGRRGVNELHALALPTPFSIGDVNVYLFDPGETGEPLTLLDTGPDWPPTREALEAGLEQWGYRVEDLGRILISHPHPDHYGLAAELAARSGAQVMAHPHSLPVLLRQANYQSQRRTFYDRWLTQNGVPADLRTAIAAAQSDLYSGEQTLRTVETLEEGDRIRIAGRRWQVLETPGHSGGMLCFFEPNNQILMTSDHLIAHVKSNPIVEPPQAGESERPRRLLQYLYNLRRVADLNPAVAYSGHGAPITDVTGLVDERFATHLRRADRLATHLSDRPATLYELTLATYPGELTPMHFFLALSSVQGHLDLLEQDRQARCQSDSDLVRWTAAQEP